MLRVLLVEAFGHVKENLTFSLNFPITCCVALGPTSSFYLIYNFQGVWSARTGIKVSVNTITKLRKKVEMEESALVTR